MGEREGRNKRKGREEGRNKKGGTKGREGKEEEMLDPKDWNIKWIVPNPSHSFSVSDSLSHMASIPFEIQMCLERNQGKGGMNRSLGLIVSFTTEMWIFLVTPSGFSVPARFNPWD
jgi:hypothetical protein